MKLKALAGLIYATARVCYGLGLIRAGNRLMDHFFYVRGRV